MCEDSRKPIPPSLRRGQAIHFGGLAILLTALAFIWELLGTPFPISFWVAAGFPILHQVWVWLAWRLELQTSAISKTIGFSGYLVSFFLLFGGRFISLAFLAFIDRGSLNLPSMLVVVISLALLVPGFYAMYSVKRYFGMARAAGGDHFHRRFREMPLVKDGIFRFTSNGMYLYAFMLFWAIAFAFNSSAAVAIAAFSHAYIWVHFWATEAPDMAYIYGSKKQT